MSRIQPVYAWALCCPARPGIKWRSEAAMEAPSPLPENCGGNVDRSIVWIMMWGGRSHACAESMAERCAPLPLRTRSPPRSRLAGRAGRSSQHTPPRSARTPCREAPGACTRPAGRRTVPRTVQHSARRMHGSRALATACVSPVRTPAAQYNLLASSVWPGVSLRQWLILGTDPHFVPDYTTARRCQTT